MHPDELWQDVVTADQLKSRSVRGASVTAVAQLAKLVLMLGSQLVLARLLLPGDFGLFAMVTPVIGFVAILADLGLTQAVVSRPQLRMAELNAFFWLNLFLSAGLAVLLSLCGPLLSWLYGEQRVTAVTIACAALVLVGGAGMLQAALLNRQLRFGAIAGIEIAALLTSVIATTLLAWRGWSYWSLVLGQATGTLTSTILLWSMSHWRPRAPEFNRGALSLARFGSNITVSNLAGHLNMTLDNIMIGAVLGRVVLGLYDRAWKLAVQPLMQIQAPFNRVAVPVLSRVVDEPARYRQAFGQMVQAMLLAIAPAMIFAALLATPLITVALGERWVPSAPIFAWLCVGAIVTPVNSASFWLLVSQGRAREQMTYGTLAAAINVAAYACGLPWGIVGVAMASALSVYLLQTPMLVLVSMRRGPVDGQAMLHLLLPNTLAAIIAAAALWQAGRWFDVSGLIPLALAAAGTFVIYAGVLACFGSTRARLRGLSAMVSLLRQKGPVQV